MCVKESNPREKKEKPSEGPAEVVRASVEVSSLSRENIPAAVALC